MADEDSRLFDKVSKGDLKAFEILFRKYYSLLCTVANSYCHDRDMAEEVIQDLFCKLWEKKQKISIKMSLRSYLLRAAYFNSINRIKQRNRDVDLSVLQYETAAGYGADQTVELAEIGELVEKTISRLPARGQHIFRLSRFEGLTYREIAGRLSISVKTVEAYMGQALRLFRKSMKEYI